MHPRGIIVASFLLAAACSAGNPPAADYSGSAPSRATSSSTPASASSSPESSETTVPSEDDASDVDTSDIVDAGATNDGWVPPPKSVCDPDLRVGAPDVAARNARFAGVTRDELTIAWTAPNEDGKTSLFVADRDAKSAGFSAPQAISVDAATDGVAIADDGLTLYAVRADHRSFAVYERAARDLDFEVGDDTMFDPILEALAPEELVGDPVFVNSGVVFLYSVYGKSADTVRMANRISIYASFYPAYTLAFDELRASGSARRRPTGTGHDFQTLFYWDEVSQTEKLARLYGTDAILEVKDLGARPWAQVNADCTKIYFGADDVLSAAAE